MQKTKFNKWEDYFKFKGLDPDNLPDTSKLLPEYQKPPIAQYILDVITSVENDGVIMDYTNTDQLKYSLWLYVKADKKRPSGFGLSYCYYVYDPSGTYSGVRLQFKDRETALAVFTKYRKFYEDLYLPYYPTKAKVTPKKIAPAKKK